jgi:TIR domain
VADFNNREQLAAWLRKQPHEVSMVLGFRWTLRALPLSVLYRGDLLSELVLPVFRLMAVSWAAVKYPSYELELAAAAARAAAARTFAVAARAAVASDAILADTAADAATTRAVVAFAARGFAAAAADDFEARAYSAAAGARAYAAVDSAAAAVAFWSAISSDATCWEEGMAASGFAGSPLWPSDQPVKLRSMWQELKAALHAEKRDWQVWTTWFDDRLNGCAREEERELAYVRIEEALWDQGAATVNAEIKRLLEANTAPAQSLPVLPSPSHLAANAASSNGLSATKTGIAVSRRPVFKGFFSYSHSDAEVDPQIIEAFSLELEKRVDAKLVNARFEIWRDKENLRAGDYWDQRIESAIKSVDIFIVLLTPKWITSDYCCKEFEIFEKVESAHNSGGYTIPIYARDIEGQARYLDKNQKDLYDRLKRIQYQQVTPTTFARLTVNERIDLIERAADPISDMLDRLRGKQQI